MTSDHHDVTPAGVRDAQVGGFEALYAHAQDRDDKDDQYLVTMRVGAGPTGSIAAMLIFTFIDPGPDGHRARAFAESLGVHPEPNTLQRAGVRVVVEGEKLRLDGVPGDTTVDVPPEWVAGARTDRSALLIVSYDPTPTTHEEMWLLLMDLETGEGNFAVGIVDVVEQSPTMT